MPVPTDTFWNIRRLNKIFAISALLLVAVTLWTILQDWDRPWKVPQRDARVWEAALVEQKINFINNDEAVKERKKLTDEIAAEQAQLAQHSDEYNKLTEQIKQLTGEQSSVSFTQS